MTFNAELVGKRYPEVRYTVTRQGVDRFNEAISEGAAVFTDPAAARDMGFAEQVGPPTIMAQLQIEAVREITADPEIGANFDGIVHGEQSYEWDRPILVGDELRTIPTITGIRSKGSISFMDIVLEVLDADGEQVVWSKSTLVSLNGERS